MKIRLKWFFLFFLVIATGQAQSADTTELNSIKDKLSYSLGASIGKSFRKDGTEIDLNFMALALRSAYNGENLLLTDKESRTILISYQTEMIQRAKILRQQAFDSKKKIGDAFLSENKTQKGVVVLPSGVQYKVLKSAIGNKPVDSDQVQVYYRGMHLNGTEFDATTAGHPVLLKLKELIPGWKEALTLMPIGSKWQLVIPYNLAYGERGVGGDIGPNETLIFEVELVAIN